MKKQMYAILDHTAAVFMNPLTFTNDADAIRWFTTVVNSEEKTNISTYPEQFTLYRTMNYDDKTGVYLPREGEGTEVGMSPKEIIRGIQVQDTTKQKHSMQDLVNILKDEFNKQGVIQFPADLADAKSPSKIK